MVEENLYLDKRQIIKGCLPASGLLFVNHDAKIGQFIPAQDFFTHNDCPSGSAVLVLTEVGGLRKPQAEEMSVYDAGLTDLDMYLRNKLDAIYGVANSSLDVLFVDGFNRHDVPHIDEVVKRTVQLLDIAEMSEDVKRRAIVAARGHDLGNIASRKAHSLLSPRMLALWVPQLLDDPQQWRIIRRAIELHNEPVAAGIIDGWNHPSPPDEVEIARKMRIVFGPEALALIIADKWDIGPHRLSDKARSREAIERDSHLVANNMFRTRDLNLSQDGRIFTVEIDFRPGLSVEETRQYSENGKAELIRPHSDQGARHFVPQVLHDMHRHYGVPHFYVAESLFWETYLDRIKFSLRAAFALFPEIERICISFSDVEDGSQILHEFTLVTLQARLAIIKKKFYPKDVR